MGTASNASKVTITNKYPDPSGGQYAYTANVVTIPSGVYVSGTHKVTWTARVHFLARPSVAQKIQVYLAESSTPGENDILIHEETFTTLATGYYTFNVTNKSFSGTSTALTNKSLGIRFSKTTTGLTPSNAPIEMEILAGGLQLNTASTNHTITTAVGSGGGGTLSASRYSAAEGTTITLTPTANTGYKLSSYTVNPNNVSILNNKFTMPDADVTVTANFSKISYSITNKSSPAAGGTVTTTVNGSAAAAATMGTTVTLGYIENTGYKFSSYSISPSTTISSGTFTMPANNVTVTGSFLKISTATLNKSSMEGGETVTLTIKPDKNTYSHKYKLSFGQNMETSLTTVTAGTTSVNITVPINWSTYIPNATSKNGGSMLVETYNGSSKIGEYTITGLTYKVPESVIPTIGTITRSIERTISGVTYANIGNYYVQGHSGIRVQVSANGARGSTIESMKLALSGYSGNKYNNTTTGSSIDFTSGLLTHSGTTSITITATDSRGRTATKTATFTVQAYAKPSGSLTAYRVNANGDRDDFGEYGGYTLSKNYTSLGSNTLTWNLKLKYGSTVLGTENSPGTTGNILPSDRKTIETTKEYSLVLTLADSLETTTITVKLPTARFIIYAEHTGNRLGFMKAPNKAIPTGKNRTVEFSDDTQIYIGNSKLEDYISALIPSVPEIHSLPVSGSTNANGNIALGSSIPQACVLTVNISGTYLAIPFYTNSQWYARVLNRSNMEVATETSVSMTVYYMY